MTHDEDNAVRDVMNGGRAKRETDGDTILRIPIRRKHIVFLLMLMSGPGGLAAWKAYSTEEKADAIERRADRADDVAAVAATTATSTADATSLKLQLQGSFITMMREQHKEEIQAFRQALLDVARRCLSPAQLKELKARMPSPKEPPAELLEAVQAPLPRPPPIKEPTP